MKASKIIIQCECGYPEYFQLIEDEDGHYWGWITTAHNMTVWQKIKYVFRFLKGKQPIYQELVFSKDQIDDLRKFLNENNAN